MLDLIIKPLSECHHNCKYCLEANRLVKGKLPYTKLADIIINKLNTIKDKVCLVFNGGDPILLTPDYYLKLADILTKNKIEFEFDIVSAWNRQDMIKYGWFETKAIENLKPFTFYTVSYDRYKHTNYTDFQLAYNTLKFYSNTIPGIISVITNETCYLLEEHISLIDFVNKNKAGLRLNYCMSAGNAETNKLAVSQYEYLNFLADLILFYRADLSKLKCEANLKNIYTALFTNNITECPISTICNKLITINPNGSIKVGCGLTGNTGIINKSCISCIFYKVCHGCKYNKNLITDIDCKNLLNNKQKILDAFSLLRSIY